MIVTRSKKLYSKSRYDLCAICLAVCDLSCAHEEGAFAIRLLAFIEQSLLDIWDSTPFCATVYPTVSGRSAAWQRASFGTTRSEVQILSPRLLTSPLTSYESGDVSFWQ